MTLDADLLRDRRRANAAPGGPHDRLVHFLFSALPIGVGMIVAVMVITPMFPRNEVSFLLDRNKVAMTRERLQVDHAVYRGIDDQGRPFSLSAGQAVQHSAHVPIVQMSDLIARLQLHDGPAEVAASTGNYDMGKEQVVVSGPVNFHTADGYHMVTSGVAIDLKARRAFGAGGVTGTMPAGTFAADRMSADLTARTVVLEGRAHLRMTPSKMVMPK
jgi:lipopolysaccharide export system protein LptC